MFSRRVVLSVALYPVLCAAQTPLSQPHPPISSWWQGPLLFLGTSHTNSVDDPQIGEIRRQMLAFKPDIVLVEGGAWPEFDDPLYAIAPYGELAYAKSLAKSLGVPADDVDPPIGPERAETLRVHGGDRASLYYALRMVPQFARAADAGGPSVDDAMSSWLKSSRIAELKASVLLDDTKALQELCSRELPVLGDWRNAADGTWWSPRGAPKSFLQTAQTTSAQFRDRYIVSRIVTALRQEKRVLVVAGAAHMVAAHELLPTALRAP